MKFNGEIKFPDLDHPGVPVQAVIDNAHFELVVEDESLGRWSLYDVEARRLVASAFLLKLNGEEVTFVASDPIDFAYRGVEHMAATWAQIKSKRLPTRSMAVRMSRKGTIPSRVAELREAMEENLAVQAKPRGIAGQTVTSPEVDDVVSEPVTSDDWDNRSDAPTMPTVGEQVSAPESVPETGIDPLAEERRRLEEDRARLEAEVQAAEQREEIRLEAYRIEMERLEQEREEARRQAETAAAKAAELDALAGTTETTPVVAEAEPEPAAPEPVAMEPEPEPEVAAPEPEPVAMEPEPEPVAMEPEPEPETNRVLEESEPEPVASVVDLNEYEGGGTVEEMPLPEPAMASPAKDKAGLMGAVRSAFARGGGRSHEHNFLEAPGGLGITRYVCEGCGYVSISA